MGAFCMNASMAFCVIRKEERDIYEKKDEKVYGAIDGPDSGGRVLST